MGHFSPAMPLSKANLASWGFEHIGRTGLFIEDPYTKGKYHPMIGALQSEEFSLLTHREQESFRNLYHNYFYERHNEFWYNNAMKKLQQLIASSNMLTCGEDLGMLNESVSRCMNNLKILSLELQIMPKECGVELGNPANYPYLSVCTTSTHDCETLRMWLSARNGTADATPEECAEVLEKNLAAPSMLAIFPLQDWLSIDGTLRNPQPDAERINIPAVADHYWKYRMHITIEELQGATSLNKKIRELSSR
jgi:4-alpha-glucanotransferase